MKNIIHFETLGCRLNQDESEGAARCFLLNSFVCHTESVTSKTPVTDDVVLCIVNTCTVTSKAEQKARRVIRLLLEKYPSSVLIITGCYAENSSKEIKCMNPERIAVLPGTKKYLLAKVPSLIENFTDSDEMFIPGKLICKIENLILKDECTNFSPVKNLNKCPSVNLIPAAFTLFTPVFQKHSRASLKIQDGCNNCCAFCKIHFARGKSVSMPPEEAVARAVLLEENGAEEIVLTGVNLSQYESESAAYGKTDFALLLKLLIEKTSRVTFRISSFYPQSITEELCSVLSNDRVQPFFHLSIQSGSDEILRKMNRPYGAEVVVNAVRMLRTAKKNPFISCDIIAGFSSETEEDFELTRKLCKECNFAWIHAFPFSPRPGTAAASMKPQIPERIKDERVKWLTEKAVEGKLSYINCWKNIPLTAVVENPRSERLTLSDATFCKENHVSQKKYKLHCVTENFIHVEFESNKIIPSGKRITVEITSACEEMIRKGKETEAEGIILL